MHNFAENLQLSVILTAPTP